MDGAGTRRITHLNVSRILRRWPSVVRVDGVVREAQPGTRLAKITDSGTYRSGRRLCSSRLAVTELVVATIAGLKRRGSKFRQVYQHLSKLGASVYQRSPLPGLRPARAPLGKMSWMKRSLGHRLGRSVSSDHALQPCAPEPCRAHAGHLQPAQNLLKPCHLCLPETVVN